MERLIKEFSNPIVQENFKIGETSFTRKRKQSFSGTLIFMCNLIRKSLSLEIENFILNLSSLARVEKFTKSAFVQYRKKINPDVFNYLLSIFVREVYTDNDDSIKLWNGFRLLAVDGSRLTLPRMPELKEIYGEAKNQNPLGVVQARVSVLYDVLNKYVLDGILSPLSVGENILICENPFNKSTFFRTRQHKKSPLLIKQRAFLFYRS